MKAIARIIAAALFLFVPMIALAGPAEEANATVERSSAAYSSNDPEAICQALHARRNPSRDHQPDHV